MNEDLYVGAFLVAWNGYLHYKQIELKTKIKNLCSECKFDFIPKDDLLKKNNS